MFLHSRESVIGGATPSTLQLALRQDFFLHPPLKSYTFNIHLDRSSRSGEIIFIKASTEMYELHTYIGNSVGDHVLVMVHSCIGDFLLTRAAGNCEEFLQRNRDRSVLQKVQLYLRNKCHPTLPF